MAEVYQCILKVEGSEIVATVYKNKSKIRARSFKMTKASPVSQMAKVVTKLHVSHPAFCNHTRFLLEV